MVIWKQTFDLAALNALNARTMNEALNIVFTEIGPDYLVADMPVTEKNCQPYRLLHGGASVVLAETLGSLASTLCIDDLNESMAVGLEVNANHLKAVKEGGKVTGVCRPIRVGRQIHVWQIDIKDQNGSPVCVSRLTVSIVQKR